MRILTWLTMFSLMSGWESDILADDLPSLEAASWKLKDVWRDGRLIGFEVSDVSGNQSGLSDGDLVIVIDGQRVPGTRPEDHFKHGKGRSFSALDIVEAEKWKNPTDKNQKSGFLAEEDLNESVHSEVKEEKSDLESIVDDAAQSQPKEPCLNTDDPSLTTEGADCEFGVFDTSCGPSPDDPKIQHCTIMCNPPPPPPPPPPPEENPGEEQNPPEEGDPETLPPGDDPGEDVPPDPELPPPPEETPETPPAPETPPPEQPETPPPPSDEGGSPSPDPEPDPGPDEYSPWQVINPEDKRSSRSIKKENVHWEFDTSKKGPDLHNALEKSTFVVRKIDPDMQIQEDRIQESEQDELLKIIEIYTDAPPSIECEKNSGQSPEEGPEESVQPKDSPEEPESSEEQKDWSSKEKIDEFKAFLKNNPTMRR